MALTQGDRLGRYEILAPLGKGGMGEVYRARDSELEREVAVKVLPEEVADNVDRLERFKREAKAVAALSHPNILEIYDVGSDNGTDYVVTELLEGETLRGRLPVSGLPWQKVVEYGAGIADGLAAAHGKGIIHRDIKPENVFITADNRVKVLDFGLARMRDEVSPEAETATLTPAGTQSGTILGTVGYMAPEQVKGQTADARSDIFALGCVLYEMVAGRQAFAGDTGVEIMAAILKEEPLQLSSTGATVPADLERAIHRCLEKSPEARFQSAADLAYNLRSIGTSSAPVMTASTGELRPAGRSARRWLLAALSVVALAVTGIVGWQQIRSSEDTSSAVEPAAEISSIPFIDEWVVVVEPFENRTGDSSLDSAGANLADRLVEHLARLNQGLQMLPALTVVAAEMGAVDPISSGSSGLREQRRMLITGSFTPQDGGLEVVAQIRDLESRQILYVTDAYEVPTRPRADELQPLLQKVMGAVGVHVQWGLEHVSHVPDYDVFRQNLVGWEKNLSVGGGEDDLEAALRADPEFLRPAFLLAETNLWGYRRDEATLYLDHIRQRSNRLTEFESLELAMLEAWKNDSRGQALRSARALQELAPTNVFVRVWRVRFAWSLNRPQEVISAAADVVDRVPRSLVWYHGWMQLNLRMAYELLGDYENLLVLARRMRHEAPGATPAFEAESAALAGLGRLDELSALVAECRSLPGGECYRPSVMMAASFHLALAGHRQESVDYALQVAALLQALPADELDQRWALYLFTLRRAEMWDEYAAYATRGAERVGEESEDYGYYLACVGMAAAHRGDRVTAESLIDEFEAREQLGYAAYVAGYLGDLERAIAYHKRAFEINPRVTYREFKRWDPDLEPLWGYEPFEELIRPKG